MKTRQISLALAAAILTCSSSAFAQASQAPGLDGFVQAAFGMNQVSGDGIRSESKSLTALRGSFAFQDQSGFGVQIDNGYDREKLGSRFDDEYAYNYNTVRTDDLAIHAFYRNNQFLVGAIHQDRKFRISAGEYSSIMPIERTFTGAEAQYYFNKLTVYGQYTRDSLGASGNFGNDVYRGNTQALEARYFISENLRTDFGITQSDLGRYDDSFRTKANTLYLGVEYRLQNSAVSLFARHLNSKMDTTDEGRLNNKRYVVGVTYNFGKGTLKERDRSGASLNPIRVDHLNVIVAAPRRIPG